MYILFKLVFRTNDIFLVRGHSFKINVNIICNQAPQCRLWRSTVFRLEQARRQEFPEGGSSIRKGVWGPLKAPRSPGVFGAKILQSSKFQALHSNFRKALFTITNF